MVLSSPSIASILVFRSHASSIMRIENIDDENVEIDKVANVVIHEINSIPFQRDIYNKHIDLDTAKQDVSPTLTRLLVFDSYYKYSIKCSARKERVGNRVHRHQFSICTPLPARDVTLTSTENKVQVINIICEYLTKNVAADTSSNRLIVTGSEETSQEVHAGVLIQRIDLKTTHEAADVIMIQQCFAVVEEGAICVKVISDDTDVFILLVHFTNALDVSSTILMEVTSGKRTGININETVEKHAHIVPFILPVHALSGCDNAPQLFGIGKTKVVNTLKKSFRLNELGNLTSDFDHILAESTSFICPACYSAKEESSKSGNTRNIFCTCYYYI